MAAAPQAKSDTAARARRDRRRQRMMPGTGADRSVGRGWVTQYPSASKRPPRAKVQPYPPDDNVTVLFPPHDGARPRAADLLGEFPLPRSGLRSRFALPDESFSSRPRGWVERF